MGQGPQGTGPEDSAAGMNPKQERPGGPEIGVQPGNGTQQMMANPGSNTHMMKQGPGPAPMPQHTGAGPQQQLTTQPQQGGAIPALHFPNVPTTSQSSRPKTPNRASPRPYHHPLTPTNRPPSTEPSEINLSPERLNASIAGLFPPKINIPLPPRPNINRGFDQQGLNPTTLKAIGQAPPNLTLPGNNNNGTAGGNNTNNQQPFAANTATAGNSSKQDKQPGGQAKRASPSNSRRSSPASSRKSATPSPGRQKGTKMAIACPPPQQQLVNPQGQTMMLSPTSVPPSPVSVPSQVGGSAETQQPQSLFHGVQGNPVEGVRESQGMATAEQRQVPQSMSQPLRDLSAPRMASPRFPAPQQGKPDLENQTGTSDRQQVHTAGVQDSGISPTHRSAPTSLNQLLDNAAIQNMPLRPVQSSTGRDVMGKDSPKSVLDTERQVIGNSKNIDMPTSVSTTITTNELEAKAKPVFPVSTSSSNLQPPSVLTSHLSTNVNSNSSTCLNQPPVSSHSNNPSPIATAASINCPTPSTNTNVSTIPNPVTSGQIIPALTLSNSSSTQNQPSSAPKQSPSPKPITSAQSVIQLPVSSSTISASQITVFVTSNPITSTPTPAQQAPTSMVSTMVAVPNKNIRPQDIRQQTPVARTPQFITTTPVFINPIFQVPGGSVAPNSTVVPHSVTMMGPIQVSTTNIQLSAASSSTQLSVANMTSAQSTRNTVGQVQITSMTSTAPVGTQQPPQQIVAGALKMDNQGEVGSGQKTVPLVQQPPSRSVPSVSAPFQPPLVSTPPCSSPGAVNAMRKSPMSPVSTAQVKGKPAQAGVVVTATVDSQQSPADRPAQSTAGAVPPQVFHPPTSAAIQTEAPAACTTAAQSNVTLPAVSFSIPIQVAVPTQIVSQVSVPAPSCVSNSVKAVPSQTTVTTAVSVSSAPLLSTAVPGQNSVKSNVPGTGPLQDVPPITSPPVANLSGVPPSQSIPAPLEPPLPSTATPTEASQIAPGKYCIDYY